MQSSILSSPHMHIYGLVVPKPCRRSSLMFDSISNKNIDMIYTVSRSLYITQFHYELPHHQNPHCPGERASQIGDLSQSCRP